MSDRDSLVLCQMIRTVWTRTSRGGRQAARRNATPEALAFAAALGRDPQNGILVHRIEFDENAGFSSPASMDCAFVDDSDFRILGVRIQRSARRLVVTLDLDPALAATVGSTRTVAGPFPTRPNFVLSSGQWGRVRYNRRHAREDTWWYEKVVANVALLLRFDSQVFLHRRLAHELDDMAVLK